MSWLHDITDQHSELESPSSFWYWSALAAVSAVVQDKIHLNKFAYKVYPNIYVMLHADSGLKKGPPVSMAKQLVRHADSGTKIISGRFSIQGALKRIGIAETKPGGIISKGSCAFICSSELTSSIVEDKAALEILTDLYDRNYNIHEWESILKMENFSLRAPIVSMLTATNAAHGDEFFGKKDIQGGYFARTFIIYEKEAANVNSLMFPLKKEINYEKSAIYLKELTKLSGEFTMEDSTRHYFDDWYKDFKFAMAEQKTKDPTGTLNRFDDSVLKVAMLISIANEPTLTIKQSAIEEAITRCETLIGNVRKTTMGHGKHQFAQEKALAIEELLRRDNHMISRPQLNKKFYLRASSVEWDAIMDDLSAAGIVDIEQHGAVKMYVMKPEAVDEWSQHLRGK